MEIIVNAIRSIKILYKILQTEPKTATVLVRDIEQYIKILRFDNSLWVLLLQFLLNTSNNIDNTHTHHYSQKIIHCS